MSTANCKGSWGLGTACGDCQRCFDEAREIIPKLNRQVTELSVEVALLNAPIPMILNCK